ncbi:MAG TPA: radical SAM family heme chaperone HemW [Blastocatellia bacterium]|nr:radical SAM family heme chaperone HemW [Blastocatellia bacterium]
MSKPAGIYIHIPFCARKCTYCNFNTTDYYEDLAAAYIEAVAKEIGYWGERKNGAAIDTIYFGGGTPSIVEPAQLDLLVRACRDRFEIDKDAEITIEINPATLSGERIAGWREAGINRASVGAQSFIASELVSLSRTHSVEQVFGTVASLRSAGFDNISIDLIAGLPEQTLEDWRFNLRAALDLRAEHLSLYLLEIKEGTQLYAQVKRGARPRPDDDLAAEMYRMICDATRRAGYEQYEISNFARLEGSGGATSPLRSKHNMKYWTAAPFHGMGCGAHAYDGRARWVNVKKTESYIESVGATGQAVAERRELSGDELAQDALFMGLRLAEGIDVEEFQKEFGLDVIARYEEEIRRVEEAGLIEFGEGRLRLSDRGRLLSNEVFVVFV